MQLLHYGNGLDLLRNYDHDYRLIQESVGAIHNLNYSYQADGQLTQLIDSIGGIQQTIAYDPLHRLTTATSSRQTGQNQDYIYDLVGNRTELHTDQTSTQYDYALDSQRLTGVSTERHKPTSYISNPQGDIDQIGTIALNYSADQRLSSVTKAKNKKHSDELGRYQYDAQGQRVAKITAKGATYFGYDLDQHLFSEDAGNPSHYVYLDGQQLALIDGAGDTAKLYYFHNNHLGAPLKVSDQAEQVVWTAELDPFGQANTINPDIVQNLRFPGQYYDQETGWHYNMQRYYDPELGRYLQSDPIGLMGGINTYTYVGGNPISYTDQQGLFFWDLLDFGFFAQSLYEYSQCASTNNAINLGLDAIGLLPGVPAFGTLRRIDEAVDVTKGLSNPIPDTVARVIPDNPITRATGTLGKSGADDIFITAASDIRALNAKQIAERLAIPESPTGFRVIEFPTPKSGIASPVNRTDPGFIGGGRTAGGAREFVIPNGAIPANARTRIVR